MKRILSILMLLSLTIACSKDEPQKNGIENLNLSETSWTGTMKKDYSMSTHKFTRKYHLFISFNNEGKSTIKVFNEDGSQLDSQLIDIDYKKGLRSLTWSSKRRALGYVDRFLESTFFIQPNSSKFNLLLEANERTKEWISIDLDRN